MTSWTGGVNDDMHAMIVFGISDPTMPDVVDVTLCCCSSWEELKVFFFEASFGGR